jgi:hypothetical protein
MTKGFIVEYQFGVFAFLLHCQPLPLVHPLYVWGMYLAARESQTVFKVLRGCD